MTLWRADETVIAGGPGWWSGNGIIQLDDDGAVRKTPRAHASMIGDPAAQIALKRALAASGWGPEIIRADRDGVVMTDVRADGFRVGTHLRLTDAALFDGLLGGHRAIARMDAVLPELDVFDELARLRGILDRLPIAPPASIAPLEHAIATVRGSWDAGPAPVPTLGDATAGNVMVRDDGSVLFVGGTLAARMDPHCLAGSLIAEFAPHLMSAREVFERFWGSFDAESFARAQTLALADDLRWAYISRIATALSADADFSPSLYGMFRAKRGLWALGDTYDRYGSSFA